MEAVLLGDDLLLREAVLAGEVTEAEPAVLTAGQVRDEEPLPGFLVVEGGEAERGVAVDAVWAAYFRHSAEVAGQLGSEFLSGWVRFEVGLRNAVAGSRAKALNLDGHDYLVEPELGDRAEDFAGALSEWSEAGNPMAAQRALDGARWEWLGEHAEWFSFGDDELGVYAGRLMLLWRWQRVSARGEQSGRGSEPVAGK